MAKKNSNNKNKIYTSYFFWAILFNVLIIITLFIMVLLVIFQPVSSIIDSYSYANPMLWVCLVLLIIISVGMILLGKYIDNNTTKEK